MSAPIANQRLEVLLLADATILRPVQDEVGTLRDVLLATRFSNSVSRGGSGPKG